MTFSPAPQNTLLLPSGTFEDPDKKHLFIIMTETCANGQQLLVPVCSIKTGVKHDAACELAAGCHPFIKKQSYVLYARSELTRTERLVKCVEGWVYTPKERLDNPVFEDVCVGLTKSIFTPRWAKKYFNENAG